MFCQFPLCQKPSTVDNPEQLPVKTENRAPLNIWLIYLTCVLFCRRILILVTIYAVCAPHAFYFLFYKVLSTKWQTVAPPCIDWNFFFQQNIIAEHEIRNISCAAQDPEDLSTFAYITKDLKTNHHYCHVFTAFDVVSYRDIYLVVLCNSYSSFILFFKKAYGD